MSEAMHFARGLMSGFAFVEESYDRQEKRERERAEYRYIKKQRSIKDLQGSIQALTLKHGSDKNAMMKDPEFKRLVVNNPVVQEHFLNADGNKRELREFRYNPDTDKYMAVVNTRDPETDKTLAEDVPLTVNGTSEPDDPIAQFTATELFTGINAELAKDPDYVAFLKEQEIKAARRDLGTAIANQTQQGGQVQQGGQQSAGATQQTNNPVEQPSDQPTATAITTESPKKPISLADREAQALEANKAKAEKRLSAGKKVVSGVADIVTSIVPAPLIDYVKDLAEDNSSEAVAKRKADYIKDNVDPIFAGNNTKATAQAFESARKYPTDHAKVLSENYEDLISKHGPEKIEEYKAMLSQGVDELKAKLDKEREENPMSSFFNPVYDASSKNVEESRALLDALPAVDSVKIKESAKPALGNKANTVVMDKVLSQLKANPQEAARKAVGDVQRVAGMKPGQHARSSGPTKDFREALIRLHTLDPSAVSLETLERGLRTGRLTKRDLQVFANSKAIGYIDKETMQVHIMERFGDTVTVEDIQKRQEKQLAITSKRLKIQDEVAARIYPGKNDDPVVGARRNNLINTWTLQHELDGSLNINDPRTPTLLSQWDRMNAAIEDHLDPIWGDGPKLVSYTAAQIATNLGGNTAEDAKNAYDNHITPAQQALGGNPSQRDVSNLATLTGIIEARTGVKDPSARIDMAQEIFELHRQSGGNAPMSKIVDAYIQAHKNQGR